jgi:hypothetical protein
MCFVVVEERCQSQLGLDQHWIRDCGWSREEFEGASGNRTERWDSQHANEGYAKDAPVQ